MTERTSRKPAVSHIQRKLIPSYILDATNMIIMGFIEPFSKELPMEYAIELNRLIKLDMSDSVG